MVILKHCKTDSDKKRLPCHDCGVLIAVVDRRAKDGEFDMLLAMSGRLGRVEPVAGGGTACPQPLATAGPACGHPLRSRATNRDDLAPGRRSQRRLPRTFLLPGGTRMQDQIRRHPVAGSGVADRSEEHTSELQ